MSSPGIGGMVPPGEDDLPRRVRALENLVAQLASARSLEAATIGEGGLVVKGGKIDVQGGGTLHVSGNTVIDGTLELPAGIIGNDALANPVDAKRCDGTSSGLTIGNVNGTRHTETMAVPSGFSTALVMTVVQLGGTNDSGGADNIRCHASINGVDGDEVVEGVSAGFNSHSMAAFSRIVTGLSNGDNITVSCEGRTSSNTWTSQTARVTAIALFLR